MNAGPALVLLIQRVQPDEILLSMAGYLQHSNKNLKDISPANSHFSSPVWHLESPFNEFYSKCGAGMVCI